MKILTLITATVSAIALPYMSFASTYHYVDTSGEIGAVSADNATEALQVSTGDRDPHSGVAIDRGLLEEGMDVEVNTNVSSNATITYQYVDVTGGIASVEAVNAQQALAISTDRATHSGVVVAEYNPIPDSVEVNL